MYSLASYPPKRSNCRQNCHIGGEAYSDTLWVGGGGHNFKNYNNEKLVSSTKMVGKGGKDNIKKSYLSKKTRKMGRDP